MYTSTTNTLADFARKAVSILDTLPGKRFDFSAPRDLVSEGVAYPVNAICIPSDDSGDIRFEFVRGAGCPWDSLVFSVDLFVKAVERRMKDAERREDARALIASDILIIDSFFAEYVAGQKGSVARVAGRLASILSDNRKRRVSFDWSSYDLDEDIPRICPYGTDMEEKVKDVVFGSDGKSVTVSTVVPAAGGDDYKSYLFDLVYDPAKADSYGAENALAFNESLVRRGIPDLLRDIYYELPESYDLGDYELDFVETC